MKQEFNQGPWVDPVKKVYRMLVGQRIWRKIHIDFQKTGIRKKIFYIGKVYPPTAKMVTKVINDDPNLPTVSVRTKKRLLNNLGFKFDKGNIVLF